MVEEENQLQKRVDKIKTISMVNNAHNLTPPQQKSSDDSNQIQIIQALTSTPRLLETFLDARGLMWDANSKKLVQVSAPVMNVEGAWKLVSVCKKISQEAEFGNFEGEMIPHYVTHFFENNYPYFTCWHENYELEPQNFNFVETTLKMYILSSFYKGKHGKYINTVTKTYSEDLLGKAIKEEDKNKDKLSNNVFQRILGGAK